MSHAWFIKYKVLCEISGIVSLIYGLITRDFYSYWLFWFNACVWLERLQLEYTEPNQVWTHTAMVSWGNHNEAKLKLVIDPGLICTLQDKLLLDVSRLLSNKWKAFGGRGWVTRWCDQELEHHGQTKGEAQEKDIRQRAGCFLILYLEAQENL